MAIAFEEIAAGVVETAVGPWALVLGAGAIAVAFAAGSARPISRMVTTGVVAIDSAGRADPRAWLRSVRRSVRGLVDEARAEYEAGRDVPALTPDQAADLVAQSGRARRPRRGAVLLATEMSGETDETDATRRRDTRGRFSPRSPNGTAQA
jgi:hypothetical protein